MEINQDAINTEPVSSAATQPSIWDVYKRCVAGGDVAAGSRWRQQDGAALMTSSVGQNAWFGEVGGGSKMGRL